MTVEGVQTPAGPGFAFVEPSRRAQRGKYRRPSPAARPSAWIMTSSLHAQPVENGRMILFLALLICWLRR